MDVSDAGGARRAPRCWTATDRRRTREIVIAPEAAKQRLFAALELLGQDGGKVVHGKAPAVVGARRRGRGGGKAGSERYQSSRGCARGWAAGGALPRKDNVASLRVKIQGGVVIPVVDVKSNASGVAVGGG